MKANPTNTKMKITEADKNHSSFKFAKVHSMNNREAWRFLQVFPEGVTSENVHHYHKCIPVYLEFSKEPVVNRNEIQSTIIKNGVEKISRSKIVMEYEKHRKAFKALVNVRSQHRKVCDEVCSSVEIPKNGITAEWKAMIINEVVSRLTQSV